MSITSTEFETIMGDKTKEIRDDLVWQPDEDHSDCVEFTAEIHSDAGWPVYARGTYNPAAPALTYVLIHRGAGRIYGLDLGKDHHNPDCENVGECHKHTWDEAVRDKRAYRPDDITADVRDPVEVWRQFCKEARLRHSGSLQKPPPVQRRLLS